MSSIDTRVVQMKFDNTGFERGVSQTMSTLDRLKKSLDFTAHRKGLDDLTASANRFHLGNMGVSIDGISNKLLALGTIGVTALSRITNAAISAGTSIVKDFTFGPITGGFQDYETQLKSIRTIVANTDAPLKEVNSALNQMNKYADQTIYNFAEMARNVGTFTAAGVGLKDSISAIKGIANIAALSGSSSLQASTAMYQLSQAIAAGRVGLQDWNSVVNAGMGGKKLQTALAQTAQAMGKLGADTVKTSGQLTINGESFRNSISAMKGGSTWLTSGVLVNALKAMDGRFSATKYAVEGFTKAEGEAKIQQARLNLEQKFGVKYTDEQFKSITKMAEAAYVSATQVSTFGGALGVVKETLRSGWQSSFAIIFGDLDYATTLWTGVSNALSGFAQKSAASRNSVIRDWSEMNGRMYLVAGIKNVFEGIMSVITPIKEAFREIFPRKTGQDLVDLTIAFWNFTKGLKIGGETANNLKRTFAGVFAVFHIGWEIVKGLAGVIGTLVGALFQGEGGILNFTGSIGDFLVSLDEAISKGGLFTGFFHGLGQVLSVPIKLITALGDVLSNIFEHINLESIINGLAAAFQNLGDAIKSGLDSGAIDTAFSGITAGIAGGIFLIIKMFIGKLSTIFSGGLFGGGGLIDSIKDTFQTLTNSLKVMQQNIQSKTLMNIATALALLAASMFLFSIIDGKKLAKSLGAMTGAFIILLGAMSVLVKISGSAGFVKVPILAASLVLLSGAMLLMSAAVAAMGSLKWQTIVKGLGGIAAALIIMSKAMSMMPKDMTLQALALVLIGAGLNEIAVAIAIMGNLDVSTIAKGLVTIGLALAIIAKAMSLMPKDLVVTGAGLVLVGVGLNALGTALTIMGAMSVTQIAKGLVTMGLALAELAIGLNLMAGTLPGAAALLVAAVGIAALTPSLLALSLISWEGMLKSIATLALVLTLLTVAGAALVASGAVLGLLGLGAALLLVGAGVALAGAGILAMVTALTMLVAIGGAGLIVLKDSLIALAQLIPLVMQQFALGLVAFVVELAKNAPLISQAFITIITAMLETFNQLIPKFCETLQIMLDNGIQFLEDNAERLANVGIGLMITLIEAMTAQTDRIVDTVTQFVVTFLGALEDNNEEIIQAGINLMIDFINDMAKAIDDNSEPLVTAAENLGESVAKGIAKGIAAFAGGVVKALVKAVADAIKGAHEEAKNPPFPSKAGQLLGYSIAFGVARGIEDATPRAVAAGKNLTTQTIESLRNALAGIDVDSEINTEPTITPVLDLSNIQKNASQINTLLTKNAAIGDVSYKNAAYISKATDEQAKETSHKDEKPVVKEIKFEQHNTSPKALSEIEIYRNTKSQLALAKEALEKI